MKKILIIEDNADIRENLAEILELADYQALTAENGKIGVEIAEAERPDLILCDVMMPVLDGFGVLNILQKKKRTADIPFIFLTAKSEKSDFRYGMNLGADDYITKPFESNELLNVIEKRLGRFEKLKANDEKSSGQFVNEAKGIEALSSLAESCETRHFSKKSSVYTEGESARYLYFIQSGKVKVFKTNDDGKELIFNILGKNDVFGYAAILATEPHAESAAALEDAVLSLMPKDDFLALLHAKRDLAAHFFKLLSGNIVVKENQLLSLAYNSVRKKVADALLLLHARYGNEPVSMLREDIAALAGTAKETLIRTLTDFKTEKLIDIEDGRIVLLKPEKLRQLAN